MRLWVILIFLIELLRASESQTNLTCHQRDLEALRDFITNLEPKPDDWVKNLSSPYCCNWKGITCDSDNNSTTRVTRLELAKLKLSGKLSESLGKLDQIKVLNLSKNSINDSIPLSIFNLVNLQTLDLSSNDLTGEIPKSLNLPSLQSLDLSSNKLNGSLPSHICQNFTHIRVLKLAVNYFSGDFTSGFGNCVSLEHLCLGMNSLTGNIPEDLFRLQSLNLLGIQENRLSGSLSSSIGNLSSLVRLDVSSNLFSGEIPNVFERMRKLKFFLAQTNRFTGGIPKSLANSPSLNLLNLRNNSLAGPLDLNCSAMIALNSLDLGTNRFNGLLPETLPGCKSLKNVNLARNAFHGQVPASFKNFQSLSYFSLSNSSSLVNISSALRILQNCKNLTTLVLTLNFRGEVLPDDSSLFRFEKLKVLVVANCMLTGSMPRWLTSSHKLQLLDLSWNRLTGAIPGWIGDFDSLFYLDLSNNSFTGQIPKSLTTLPSLTSRNISFDEPAPDFPLFMKRNESTRGLQYNQIVGFPPTIELGHNNLSGPIWEEFGNLKKLHVFDLKYNKLSGSIPGSLSGMTSLEALDLSNNRLSGSIPVSLQKLTFLSKFIVASNNLSGRIPSGGQFQTFPNSSFEHNDLCGEHRFPCPEDRSNGRYDGTSMKRKKSRGGGIGMAIGIAFGSVFLLTLLALIVLRARRRSGEVDPEIEEESMNRKEIEEIGSKLVILFQNNGKELSFDDLLDSTENFDQANIIGCGGFGLVYKAMLPDGRKVAIKRLSGDCGQIEREFKAEVETLSRAQHPNLVLLQGFCFYKTDRLLIYSYMENGSLDYWLHERNDGPALLDWKTRLRIAQGAARGLFYLHDACDPHILHRDIKSSNILLDENFDAHLADFGLARLMSPYETHVSTDLVGTLGYIPPEYGQASVATYKGDVYSFGVVLLELLTDKRPVDMCKPKGGRDLISWVFRMKNENRASEVFDPFIYSKENEKEMFRVLEVACLCLSENPKQRPTTQQLVSWLEAV